MKLTSDRGKFDGLQMYLTGQIVETVYEALGGAGIPKRKRQELATRVAFNVCAAIDGSLIMKHKGKDVVPILTFAADKKQSTLIYNDGPSDMHEYVHGAADDVFGK